MIELIYQHSFGGVLRDKEKQARNKSVSVFSFDIFPTNRLYRVFIISSFTFLSNQKTSHGSAVGESEFFVSYSFYTLSPDDKMICCY